MKSAGYYTRYTVWLLYMW